MARLVRIPRLNRLLAGLMLAFGLVGLTAPAASAAVTDSMPDGNGWIRLAHLSPNTPAVDVYLYSFGDPRAQMTLHHVAYGTVSAYLRVAAGEYTAAMRGAGSAASSQPVLSTTLSVKPGGAYTVAGMGPASGLRLRILKDQLETPKGKILIRVIQASMAQHQVTVTAGKEMLASKLTFGSLTTYRVANPGTWVFHAVGESQHAAQTIKLTPNCIHTIVVVDAPGHLKIDDLLDAAGETNMPMGGVETGLGGTAPRPAPPAMPWLVTVAGGGLLTLAGAVAIRRAWHRPLHAR